MNNPALSLELNAATLRAPRKISPECDDRHSRSRRGRSFNPRPSRRDCPKSPPGGGFDGVGQSLAVADIGSGQDEGERRGIGVMWRSQACPNLGHGNLLRRVRVMPLTRQILARATLLELSLQTVVCSRARSPDLIPRYDQQRQLGGRGPFEWTR
jgi:hypothetical protein